jgi:hypothetical protein
LGLEVIHQKLTRLKAHAAVCRGHGNQHNLVLGLQQSNAVDHTRAVNIKAFCGLFHHRGDGLLRHAWVVL